VKPCPCGATPTTSSDITYSVVWCGSCRRTLTGEYSNVDHAILAWQHGVEVLPPNCPFCHWSPAVIEPASETPQVMCTMPCPLRGRVFTLAEWNQSRPKPYRLEELVKRWEKKRDPALRAPIKALKRAIEAHVRNRFRGDG
jgi:hypothetical protein